MITLILRENNERLVQAGLYPEKIIAHSWYYGEGLKGSIPEIWVREGLYERLLTVTESLPDGMRLVIWDGWRSYELQQLLFMKMVDRMKAKGHSHEDAHRHAAVFVYPPSKEADSVSWHLTGGAVDLTLADRHGRLLDMGGNFDDTDEHSHTHYYESHDNPAASGNRKMLLQLMTGAGFSNYPSEWWHYDYGNRGWAERTGAAFAFYGYCEPPFKWRD